MSFFGLIVSGRLVQTDFQQFGTNQFLTTVPDADNVNHIVVFLTGVQPLPEGFGGSVYFSWPDPAAPPSWQYLGFISNAKPSAIFKITKLKHLNNPANITFGSAISHNAQIGISIEPMFQIQSLTPAVAEPSGNDFMEFTTKMVENCFNYVASFGVTQSQMRPSNDMFVPLGVLRDWYANFQRRLSQIYPKKGMGKKTCVLCCSLLGIPSV
uniref:EOG090X0D82 n=1 Tax=Lynceus sp. MCZ IZ 141354 TaxID=1930659 RepID=A0A9N6WRJ7_9CRUS|nr:EOG090X0D82 [Lynceus sp. MCZ IZ 141354]